MFTQTENGIKMAKMEKIEVSLLMPPIVEELLQQNRELLAQFGLIPDEVITKLYLQNCSIIEKYISNQKAIPITAK